MSKIAIVYWSSTGNTGEMANYVSEGAKTAGADVSMFTASEFTQGMVDTYDALAFGCPSMGAEVLEEGEFQPMWDSVEPKLKSKKVALFGSYGWGDGEWMRNWEESCVNSGINIAYDSVICNEAPDDEAVKACKDMGEALANN